MRNVAWADGKTQYRSVPAGGVYGLNDYGIPCMGTPAPRPTWTLLGSTPWQLLFVAKSILALITVSTPCNDTKKGGGKTFKFRRESVYPAATTTTTTIPQESRAAKIIEPTCPPFNPLLLQCTRNTKNNRKAEFSSGRHDIFTVAISISGRNE